MTDLQVSETTFTKGEIARTLRGRHDTVGYHHGADRLWNILPLPGGGFRDRPGTVIKSALPMYYEDEGALPSATWPTFTAPNGGTVADVVDDAFTLTFITTTNISTTSPYTILRIRNPAETNIGNEDGWMLNVYGLNISGTGGITSDEIRVSWEETFGGGFTDINPGVTIADEFGVSFSVFIPRKANIIELRRVGSTDLGTRKFQLQEIELLAIRHDMTKNVAGDLLPAGLEQPPRVVQFAHSADAIFDIVVQKNVFHIFDKDGTLLQRVGSIFVEGTPPTRWAAKDDTILFFHESHRPTALQWRGGNNKRWHVFTWPLSNVPTFTFPDSGASEPVWSVTRGWPGCGVFFQGRLWLAGATSRPSTVWASKAGDETDFALGTGAADDAIQATANISGNQIAPHFHSISVGPHLQFFSTTAEYYAPSSDDTPQTPENFSLRRATEVGSTRNAPVVFTQGAAYFIDDTERELREFVFSEVENNYIANDVTVLAPHILIGGMGAQDLGVFRNRNGSYVCATTWIPAVDPVEWEVVGDDSTHVKGVITFLTDREQEVAAWSHGFMPLEDRNHEIIGMQGDALLWEYSVDDGAGGTRIRYGYTKANESAFHDLSALGTTSGAGVLTGLGHFRTPSAAGAAGPSNIGVTQNDGAGASYYDFFLDKVVTATGTLTGLTASKVTSAGRRFGLDPRTGLRRGVSLMPPATAEVQEASILHKKTRVAWVQIDFEDAHDIRFDDGRALSGAFLSVDRGFPERWVDTVQRFPGLKGWSRSRTLFLGPANDARFVLRALSYGAQLGR